jgi:HYDIN/CFA65/VesB-like, Ig-like domain/Cep192 domain 4
MRRTRLALIAIAAALVAAGSAGSSALGIDPGPLTANPDPVNFHTVAQGAPQTTTVTLTNNSPSSTTLTIAGDPITGTDQADFSKSSDTCNGATLNVTDHCTVDITFSPSTNSSESASLDITDDDSAEGAAQSLSLSGTGVASQFTVSPNTINFGQQRINTTSSSVPVTVTNNTSYSATPSGPSIGGANSGDFSQTGCGGSVGGGSNCVVNVTFTPSALGGLSATLNVAGTAVALSGTGVQPGASLSPTSISFGSQPKATTSATKTITLTNTGTGPLTYTTPPVVGGSDPNSFSVSDGDCASTVTVPSGGSCAITVQFVPTATGKLSATIAVHDNAPSSPQTVTVSGKGTASSMAFGPPTVIFTKPIPAGTASPAHTVTVFNTTSAAMPIASTAFAGANPKNFTRTADNCSGTTVPVGGKCTIRVRFIPSAAGLRSALLEVNDTGPVSPHQHSITLTGHATYPRDPKQVHPSSGCNSARISWVKPSSVRYRYTLVVRNHSHVPTSPSDGTRVRHTSTLVKDTGLKHFTTYYYRVYAVYRSATRAGRVNYSRGAKVRLATGRICTPQNNSRIGDTTPYVTWLAYPHARGYGFVLQSGGRTIAINYPHAAHWQLRSSWSYRGRRHGLVRGGSYTFFLYAYTPSHPRGILIGQTFFHIT